LLQYLYDILPSISKNIIIINVKPETVSRFHAGSDVVCNELSPLIYNTINKMIRLISITNLMHNSFIL